MVKTIGNIFNYASITTEWMTIHNRFHLFCGITKSRLKKFFYAEMNDG